MQQAADPHLPGAIAPQPPHADALAAMGDKPLIQKDPFFQAFVSELPERQPHTRLERANRRYRQAGEY